LVLEEHLEICERNENFNEAVETRNRIELLKKIEESKILLEFKEKQKEDVLT